MDLDLDGDRDLVYCYNSDGGGFCYSALNDGTGALDDTFTAQDGFTVAVDAWWHLVGTAELDGVEGEDILALGTVEDRDGDGDTFRMNAITRDGDGDWQQTQLGDERHRSDDGDSPTYFPATEDLDGDGVEEVWLFFGLDLMRSRWDGAVWSTETAGHVDTAEGECNADGSLRGWADIDGSGYLDLLVSCGGSMLAWFDPGS